MAVIFDLMVVEGWGVKQICIMGVSDSGKIVMGEKVESDIIFLRSRPLPRTVDSNSKWNMAGWINDRALNVNSR